MGYFSLTRVFVVSFVFLGMFATLFGFMPSQFFALQTDYVAPTTQDKEVVEFFSTHNLTLYKNSWSFNIIFGEMKYKENVPTTDHWLECHWHYINLGGILMLPVLEFRHSYPSWFFGLWREYHNLELTDAYRYKVGGSLYWALHKTRLLQLQLKSSEGEYAYFEMSCSHITVSVVVTPTDANQTLSEAWDSGQLHVLLSYDIDWDAMKPSAWTLIGQLITFQNPDLGIPGVGGQILSYMIGCVLWICVAITIYTIATRLIPTIQGGIED